MSGKLEVEVEFSGLSIGEITARLGVKIHRNQMKASVAEKFLCGSRLDGEIRIKNPEEPELPSVPTIEPIKSTFDVKGYNAKTKSFSTGLTFNVDEIDIALLAHFPNKKGLLSATRISDNGDD